MAPSQVSCVALSRSGKYLASGQVTYTGFTAPIILWDLETLEIVHKVGRRGPVTQPWQRSTALGRQCHRTQCVA